MSLFLANCGANAKPAGGGGGGGLAVYDDFAAGSVDTAKWDITTATDITISQSGGVLKFTGDGAFSGGGTAKLKSDSIFDFTGKTVEVDLPNPTGNVGASGTGAGGYSSFQIGQSASEFVSVQIIVDTDTVYFRRLNTTFASSESNGAYSADSKWRIEHVSSNNTWKFYTWDGSAWQLRFTSAAANWNPTSVKFKMEVEISSSNQISAETQFAEVRTDATF